MARVLLVTHGTAGDVLPFVRIGAAVRALGHEARLIGPAPYAAAAARAGLDFAAPDTEAGYRAAQRRTPDLLAARRPADLRDYYEREGLFDQLRREAERLASWHEPGRTVLVGRHTSALSALVAAELLGAPVAWVAVAPIQLMVAPVAAAHVRHGLAGGIGAVRSALGLPPVADWPAWLRSARATLGLWPAWFDAAGPPAPPGTTLTGFVSGDAGGAAFSGDAGDDSAGGGRDDRAGGRAVLGTGGTGGTGGGWDDGAGVAGGDRAGGRPVLVTGGTGQLLHPDFYRVALDAVAALGHPAIVVAPERELLPDRLPPGVTWRPRLPFPAVLPHAAALLHHGGIGTAVRALRSGTPQVILAHGADRPDNAARLARHGLARWLPEERWDPAAIAAELAAAMTDAGLGPRAARLLDEPEDAAPDRAARALLALLDAPPPAPGAAPPPPAAGAAPPPPSAPSAGPPPAAGDAPVRSVRGLTPEQRRLLLRRLAAGPR